jgi:Flp pilus assembly protein TadG
MSLIIVGMGMMAFMAAGMLAVDVGMLMTSRAQSQNAADAGAFAGAIALAYNDYTDRSATGPAVIGAIAAAKANTVMHEEVSINPDVDVTDPSAVSNRVTVTVRRAARGNPLSTFLAALFGHARWTWRDRDRRIGEGQRRELRQAVGDPRPLGRF